jgi:hypothetical protein
MSLADDLLADLEELGNDQHNERSEEHEDAPPAKRQRLESDDGMEIDQEDTSDASDVDEDESQTALDAMKHVLAHTRDVRKVVKIWGSPVLNETMAVCVPRSVFMRRKSVSLSNAIKTARPIPALLKITPNTGL